MASPTTSGTSQTRNKFSKTLQRVMSFKNPTKSNNVSNKQVDQDKLKYKASMDAFVSKLFASVSSLKAAYAELQDAQFPYDENRFRLADQAVVDELKSISLLKRLFYKKQIHNSPPHVTLLLSEIQEQQSLMKTYRVTMNQLENQIKSKDLRIDSLKKELEKANSVNELLELKVNSSNCFPLFDNLSHLDLKVTHFVLVLKYALRSIQDFVKLLVCEMESANWNIDAAVKSAEPNSIFVKASYKCFVFESFVAREMFEGFDLRSDEDDFDRLHSFNQFKELKSLSSTYLLNEYPRSSFAKFTRSKYMRLVHPKMEFSFYGNLNQRKTLNEWRFPETTFFNAFSEMARLVWILRCLALSFDEEVSLFRVRKECRFSNVYMESVTEGDFRGDQRVSFTVVPGFKIGEKIVQSQVYVSPALR